jgi:hypothetical protein
MSILSHKPEASIDFEKGRKAECRQRGPKEPEGAATNENTKRQKRDCIAVASLLKARDRDEQVLPLAEQIQRVACVVHKYDTQTRNVRQSE